MYTKKWWTEDLSNLRKSYTRLRNLSRRKRRNREQGLVQLEAQVWEAKCHYFKPMRAQKKKHWEEFLEDTDNIWQAAKYLTPSSISKPIFSPITRLRSGNATMFIRIKTSQQAFYRNFFHLSQHTLPLHNKCYQILYQ